MAQLNRWLTGPGVARWLTEAVPRGRVAAFRTLVYLFVAADLVWFTPWVRAHAALPGELYQPLFIGRLLHLPTPNGWLVNGVFWTLLATALAAATNRAPRLLGWAVCLLYFEWMIIAMSYGKVDHDRFALLVALALLPTAGVTRWGDRTLSERCGWVLRVTQLAVVATYFLASWAKLRFGGPGWMFGSVLMRSIIRRGTWLTDLLTSAPKLMILAQIGIMAFELASPLVFLLRARWRYLAVAFFYSFHVVTIATITISFAPHLVAMTSFLPLERVRPIAWARRLAGATAPATAPTPENAPAGSAPGVDPDPEVGGGGAAEPVTLGLRQGADGGATGHPVSVSGNPAVDGPRQGEHRPAAQNPAENAPEPA